MRSHHSWVAEIDRKRRKNLLPHLNLPLNMDLHAANRIVFNLGSIRFVNVWQDEVKRPYLLRLAEFGLDESDIFGCTIIAGSVMVKFAAESDSIHEECMDYENFLTAPSLIATLLFYKAMFSFRSSIDPSYLYLQLNIYLMCYIYTTKLLSTSIDSTL